MTLSSQVLLRVHGIGTRCRDGFDAHRNKLYALLQPNRKPVRDTEMLARLQGSGGLPPDSTEGNVCWRPEGAAWSGRRKLWVGNHRHNLPHLGCLMWEFCTGWTFLITGSQGRESRFHLFASLSDFWLDPLLRRAVCCILKSRGRA